MHYLTLVTLEMPKLENDYEKDEINRLLLQSLQEAHEKKPDDIIPRIYLGKFNGLKTTFAREVDAMIEEELEPYCESTENPDYLEFEDHTDELRAEYENNSIDCIKLPDGRTVSICNNFVRSRFVIHDGKVFERNSGPLKCDRRTKKAKKMTAVPNYPYKKLYKTFEAFAETERYMDYSEEFGGYGYLYNPNAFWDWYQIGGRWPNLFLVEDSCEECTEGEYSWACQGHKPISPQGYKWVCAARKRDIAWQTMQDWKIKTESERYELYKKIFETGEIPDGYVCKITEKGVIDFTSFLYVKDESLEEYLTRRGFLSQYEYPNIAYAFLKDGEYYSQDQCIRNQTTGEEKAEWHKIIDGYIRAIPDDTVIVGVDCHI